jgi:uncharacterized protein
MDCRNAQAIAQKNLNLKFVNINAKPYICFYFNLNMDKKTSEFYVRLKEQLDEANVWPAKYLYKFIVPSEKEKIEMIENAFDQMGAVIDTRQSKTGKFTSISVDVMMPSAELIIKKYQEVSAVEGIISL